NSSGVSRNNRLLERHDASYGAYWRSYDFAENIERQNLFEHPLGPQAGGTSFEHSGGEIIFNLPNGLQAYMLVDAKGRRLDRAPIDIVSDPKRPDKIVETAISCFSCHYQGVIPKADQIRAHVEKNPNVFSKEDTAIVKALYPPEASFKALVEEDAERFRKALAKTGASAGEPEPVATFTLRYEGEVDMAAAAGEAGLQPEEFLKRLGATPAMGRALGALKVQGGTVQRQVFQALFGDLVREFHLGDGLATVSNPRNLLNSFPALRPFEGHTGHILAIAFAPAGNQAISGSEDNTVRLWDLTGGREIRCCEGHTGEVLAVAFSTDGKRALSGSMDRTVRLWDLTSGRELRRFEGPTERISSVAFSPDGKRALSGSWDQTLSLWNLETGKELMRLGGHAGYISTVAFSPDGRQALSGSYDRTVRLWDLTSGKPVRVFDGSDKEIYAVAFSPDGKRILSGGNDNLVRLWNAETGQEIRNWVGPAKAIIRVAFSPDGKRVLAGSSQYQGTDTIIRVWDGETGLNLGSFGGKNDTAWSIAFATDGWRALSANIDKTLRLWDLSK
ncbi:MAG TPA: WD40 repeat domain-containing protein, partial [Gemmataceae bacterium]|nr:WD40 repeat domain-containing protein [Gemmataceae bacterium]